MNNKEKFYAEEKKIDLVAKAGYRCTRCGITQDKVMLQLAHRIMKASESKVTVRHVQKYVLETYNEEIKIKEAENIINHELNLVVSCPKCNDSFNIWNDPEATKAKIREICNKIYGWSEEV